MRKFRLPRLGLLISGLMMVAVGAAAPAQAVADTGSIAGHLTDNGSPVVHAFVTVYGPSAVTTTTDVNGFYRAEGLQPGPEYRVTFSMAPGLTQFAQSKLTDPTATRYTVTAGAETIVDDSLLPRGSATGRFVDSDGSPIAGASVTLNHIGGSSGPGTTTDANGFWTIGSAFAASYEVLFQKYELGIYQLAFGKPAFDPGYRADPVTVTANTTTTVNDTALPRGDVLVHARDSLTGAPVNSFYAEIFPRSGSTETGTLLIQSVQAGTRNLNIFGEGHHSRSATVAVTGGAQAEVTVDLVPASALEVTAVDAATGAPVPGVCIQLTTLTDGTIDSECDEPTDEQGHLTRTFLEAGTYQVFAAPVNAPGYGAQWVGPHGGTGRQLQAKSITLSAGQTKSLTIKMDRAGTITGRVTKPDGQPAASARVGLVQGGYPICCGGPVTTSTDENGFYTIDFAGPYDWPLSFVQDNLQFAGHTANRHLAQTVRVRAGATTTYDYRFKAGTAVTATVLGRSGDTLVAHNAFTGDTTGWSFGDLSEPQHLSLLGPQFVKFRATGVDGEAWFGGDSFADASIFFIPGSGSKSITLNFG
ncbi:hypothetical protein Rhe02_42100 [Rhizocola hellebori]|uniref:Alpha-amylase n=1 Tax=Rhizocola hellebori TaxID=1392758 RepID=A0A8J3QAG0_9ACTN|nr:carboxypeptidase-like regulatory domain-containing protein [Rhizocola hellebori]GIH06143.1 hypothetical protein Rhe02_42100 [Rhizocola hellebori]